MREELLQEAFRKYGTPLYVFDLDILKEQTERIRAGFGPEINLCYAMKANPFLTGYMAQWSDRIEVCSMGEFRICRKLQVPPEKLFISGVMKKRDDIREILAYCGNRCAYTVESHCISNILWNGARNIRRMVFSDCIRDLQVEISSEWTKIRY